MIANTMRPVVARFMDAIRLSNNVPLRIITPTMATSAVTPPTEISILPVIMTIVRPQEIMTRYALSLSMSNSI